MGSNGFKYTRYTISQKWSTTELFTMLRGANTLVVEEDNIRTELRSPELSEEGMYAEYWRGYFYAARDG